MITIREDQQLASIPAAKKTPFSSRPGIEANQQLVAVAKKWPANTGTNTCCYGDVAY